MVYMLRETSMAGSGELIIPLGSAWVGVLVIILLLIFMERKKVESPFRP